MDENDQPQSEIVHNLVNIYIQELNGGDMEVRKQAEKKIEFLHLIPRKN